MKRLSRLWGAAVLAGAVGLSGCAAESPADIEDALSAELTSDVSSVAEAAAAGDYSGAIGLLDGVTAKVNGAASDGRITGSRLVTLQQSISTVRADLETLLAAASTPAPEPTQTEDTGQQTVVDTPAEEGPVEEAPADEAPAEKEPKDDKGPGKDTPGSGPGENSGQGKDKKK